MPAGQSQTTVPTLFAGEQEQAPTVHESGYDPADAQHWTEAGVPPEPRHPSKGDASVPASVALASEASTVASTAEPESPTPQAFGLATGCAV
jgi:hypothetical protein